MNRISVLIIDIILPAVMYHPSVSDFYGDDSMGIKEGRFDTHKVAP